MATLEIFFRNESFLYMCSSGQKSGTIPAKTRKQIFCNYLGTTGTIWGCKDLGATTVY